jgi:hypothetical protein
MAKQLSETELRRQAVQALSDSLGPVDALRFLALVSRELRTYTSYSTKPEKLRVLRTRKIPALSFQATPPKPRLESL